MVVSPLVILKRNGNGFTLAEILIAVAIVAVLAIFVLVGLRGMTQIQKARDTRRKSDLHLVSRALEEYYNDHGYYLPGSQYFCGGTALQPYLERIPCDIYRNLEKYEYVTDGSSRPPWYRLYTKLQYTSDPLIQYVGCFPGCVVGSETYNYFVASPNAPTTGGVGTTGGPGGTPTPVPPASPTPTPAGTPPPLPTPTPTATPIPTPTPTPSGGGPLGEPTPTPTPSGVTCNNPVAPTCAQPELYVNLCASCCPGSEYIMRFISGSYWCCYDPLTCPGP